MGYKPAGKYCYKFAPAGKHLKKENELICYQCVSDDF